MQCIILTTISHFPSQWTHIQLTSWYCINTLESQYVQYVVEHLVHWDSVSCSGMSSNCYTYKLPDLVEADVFVLALFGDERFPGSVRPHKRLAPALGMKEHYMYYDRIVLMMQEGKHG